MALETWIERASPALWWSGGVVSFALGGLATIPLVGAADWVAVGTGMGGLCVGAWAGFARRALDRLPLRLSQQMVRRPVPGGHELVLRGILGRGRRIDRLVVTADGVSIFPWEGPLVGMFLVSFPFPSSEVDFVELDVRASEGAEVHEQRVRFLIEDATEGRYVSVRTKSGWTSPEKFAEHR